MREIKFRYYDKLHKRMWYGHQAGESEGEWTFQEFTEKEKGLIGIIHRTIDVGFGRNNGPSEEIELPIMQYTGLKDKNFKEIYEKDIVKYKDYGEEHISKVIQDLRLGTGHYIKSPGIGFYSINERTIKDLEIEVIGNVFEDSHLLEEQHG